MLVFPKVTKAGIGIGGERGNGALLVDGETIDYYTTTSASVGLQLGGQTRSQIILFMTREALESFQNSIGWEVGVDASVALATIGTGGELVFQGLKRGKPLSDMTLTKVMRDAGLEATPHGFRSSFKDWAAETTGFANELSEAALAHVIANKTEAAYRRGNLLEKRREMMNAWGSYCEGEAKVVRLAVA